jgi:polyhydroxyalkanoate synthesis regulator phasin
VHALASNSSGSNNVAVGWHAGYNLTTGSNNIDIGSPGVKAESGIIRIGTITGTTSTQAAAYVAGIYGVTTGTAGLQVVIDSSGQLGTVSSSIRYKEDVQPMAGATERLLKLRPVKFRYKKAGVSGEKPIQYGLIAEEVAEVYPELVVRDATTGRIDGVRYDELAPMLLNEVQQQQSKMTAQAENMAAQAERIAAQDQHSAAQDAQIHELKQQVAELKNLKQEMAAISAALRKIQTKDALVARR